MVGNPPFAVRWGILATGGIAQTFTKDLLRDPATRNVSDVQHIVVAAASSTSKERAAQFLKDCGAPSSAVAYGSYKELVADPSVDIIYVATPHSHHFQNAMLCLEAGKPVLCEKAFTVNAAQAKLLCQKAKEKNVFLMEAVWTRFFPLSKQIRSLVSEGKLGTVHRVIADLSFGEDVEEKWGTKHRMTNPDLAGGALLDLGIYPLTWVFQILYHLTPPALRQAPTVTSSATKYHLTGVDETTSIILTFPPPKPSSSSSATTTTNTNTSAIFPSPTHGIATTSMRISTDPTGHGATGPAIRIQGTKAEIQVDHPAFRPTRYRFIPRVAGMEGVQGGKGGAPGTLGDGSSSSGTTDASTGVREVEIPIPGQGMFWEADECARCLRDGKKESDGLGHAESIAFMDVLDEVRRQNHLSFPARIESTEFPLEGF
ncbi:MAG: hypothetical protein M1819_001584 [Sarea resinae]|nr:MAG: hypothetical protein M1819_001584 [Sarea resinae]